MSLETRRRLAAEAFATTAEYEAAIAHVVRATANEFPEQLTLLVPQGLGTFRTARTHTRGRRSTEEVGARKHLLSRVEQLGGKELSYNNLADLEGARRVAPPADRAGES